MQRPRHRRRRLGRSRLAAAAAAADAAAAAPAATQPAAAASAAAAAPPQGASGAGLTSTTLCLLRRQRLDLASIPPNQLNQHFAKLLFGLHATLAFKLRRMRPAPVAVFQVSSG